MKIKNKDGTVNSLPIVLIVSVFIIASYLLVFGFDFDLNLQGSKKPSDGEESTYIATKKQEQTTINLCLNCSMRFNNTSVDVATNASVDISSFLNLDGISIRNVNFEVSDANIISVQASGNTYLLSTGNLTGTATLYASYADVKAEININVISIATANVNFKYPYYFVATKGKVTPELDVYPLGYNISGISYTPSSKDMVSLSVDKNTSLPILTGKKLGEMTLTLNIGNSSSSTKIYVVENKVTVKVLEGDVYKERRSITPLSESFDVLVTFQDKYNQHFDNKSLSVSFDNQGLNASASYVGRGKESNSYIYHIEVYGAGKSTMRVDLADGYGSFTLFEINK